MAYDPQEAAFAADSDPTEGYADVADRLGDLIAAARGSRDGLSRAADALDDDAAALRLRELASRRGEMADELEGLGSAPSADESGSLGAALKRAWTATRITTAMSDRDVLAAVESSEDRAVGAYRDAVAADLPPQAMAVVRRQLRAVEEAHDTVRAMRDSHPD